MAVVLVATIQRWLGRSTDTKPSGTIQAGSTFQELDTGKMFLWDGDSWVEDVSLIYAVFQGAIGVPEVES